MDGLRLALRRTDVEGFAVPSHLRAGTRDVEGTLRRLRDRAGRGEGPRRKLLFRVLRIGGGSRGRDTPYPSVLLLNQTADALERHLCEPRGRGYRLRRQRFFRLRALLLLLHDER